MTAIKFKMFSSLIFGPLSILLGLYLFFTQSDKTTGRFFILIGLASEVIGLFLYFAGKKRESKKLADK